MNTLIEIVRNGKAVFYPYYNSSIQYDQSKADSISYYPINFLREYSDAEYQGYKKQGLDKMHMDFKNEYFRVALSLYIQNNSVMGMKPLGIIAYGRRNYPSGDLYGYIGYGCFVFK